MTEPYKGFSSAPHSQERKRHVEPSRNFLDLEICPSMPLAAGLRSYTVPQINGFTECEHMTLAAQGLKAWTHNRKVVCSIPAHFNFFFFFFQTLIDID